MGQGDIISLTDSNTKATIDGIGGRDTSEPLGEISNVFFNESMDGVPRKADLFTIRALGQTSQIEWLKDIIKSQISSIEFDVVVDIPDEQDREPTDQELEAAEEVRKFFQGGFNDNDETIDDLHGKLLDDILDLNSGILELVSDESGYLDRIIVRDGITFTINQNQHGELPAPDSDEPAYYQFGLTNHARQLFGHDRDGIDLNHIREHINEIQFDRLFSKKETKEFSRDQIVWFSESQNKKTYSPYGRGRTEKVKDAAEIMINGDIHRNKFFLDNEFHKGVMAVGPDINQESKSALKDRFKGSAGKEHELPVIGTKEDIEYISIDPEPEKMQFLESQKWYTKRVVWAYGLNDVEGGALENANKGISDNGKRQIWERVTSGLIEMFENRWNNQVLPFMREYEAVDGNLKVVYRPDNKFVEKIENEIISNELDNDMITINEARERKDRDVFGELGNLTRTAFKEYARNNPAFVVEQLTDLEDVPTGDGGGNPFENLDADEIDNLKKKYDDERESRGKCAGENRRSENKSIEDVDLTPPEAVKNAAQAALDFEEENDDRQDCGTGVGDSRANSITNETLSPEDFLGGENTAIPDYLESHEEDVTAEGPATDWSDEEMNDCGNRQYAKWGGTGTGTGLEWAKETERKLQEAKEDEEKEASSGGTDPSNITDYRDAFKHTDYLLEHTKDALRNERGFKDVPGIVEHKEKMQEEIADAFQRSLDDLQEVLEQEFPKNSQENGVLVDADEMVQSLDIKERISSILESNNLGALEMSAEHFEKDIEQETQERFNIPSETKVEISFDILDTFTADIIRQESLQAATEIDSTVKDRLKNQILKGAEEGEGIPQITDRVSEVSDNISKNHSELVARTETLQSSRKGSQALAESTDLVGGKEWIATNDARVREWHSAMDGTVISKDMQFEVPNVNADGQPSNYPRSARVVGEDQPFNCRCSQAPVLAEDMPDSVTQLDAEFDNVSVDLGMTKRKYEVWKEHSKESEDSFEKFWTRFVNENSVKDVLNKTGMSQGTYYDWKDEHNIK